MKPLKSLMIAFSMFTVIPMPQAEWKKENMRFIFCWFPLIGTVLGIIEYIWYFTAVHFGLGCFIYAAVATVIPVALTGGIHIDGFMDTCDALSSHKDKDKMQQILADPHTGAFAIIYTFVYFIIYFGALTQLYNNKNAVICFCASYTFVRAMATVFIMNTEFSKKSGILYALMEHNITVVTAIITVVWIMGSLYAMEYSSLVSALGTALLMILFTVLFKRTAVKRFGGVSGDLAGFFISVSELICLFAAALGSVVS